MGNFQGFKVVCGYRTIRLGKRTAGTSLLMQILTLNEPTNFVYSILQHEIKFMSEVNVRLFMLFMRKIE